MEILLHFYLKFTLYRHFRLFHNAEHGNCYTFNAQWNMPDHKILYAYESDMWNKPTGISHSTTCMITKYLIYRSFTINCRTSNKALLISLIDFRNWFFFLLIWLFLLQIHTFKHMVKLKGRRKKYYKHFFRIL